MLIIRMKIFDPFDLFMFFSIFFWIINSIISNVLLVLLPLNLSDFDRIVLQGLFLLLLVRLGQNFVDFPNEGLRVEIQFIFFDDLQKDMDEGQNLKGLDKIIPLAL